MPKSKKPENNKKSIIIAATLAGVVLIGTSFFFWQKSLQDTHPQAVVTETQPVIEKPAPPVPQFLETAPQPPPEPLTVQTTAPTSPPPAPIADIPPCKLATNKMEAFFTHLDQQEYIKKYGIKNNSKQRIAKITEKLYANPPVVMRETDDLFSIITNSAHFYRILGKDNLMLLKEILTNETDNLEIVMAGFYQWSEMEPDCTDSQYILHLPLKNLYEYAGFFLNTLGGQSYLFRRESRIRMLVKYYSVLIIDQANEKGLNRHGLDIRQPLRSTIDEMEVSSNLQNREDYLENLLIMQAKYQEKYGN